MSLVIFSAYLFALSRARGGRFLYGLGLTGTAVRGAKAEWPLWVDTVEKRQGYWL
jgi:hypothetical protein